MAEDLKFQIGAEDTGVAAVMAEVKETVVTSIEQIQGSLAGLTAAFEVIQGAFLAITAVLAGGAAFKDAVESTVNMTVNAQALGRQLGISATDASVLNVALASVFVTQDQYSAAAGKVTLALKKNESAFTDLGVATRDSNGNLVSTQAIIQSTSDRLLQFKEGTDRNVEGVKIFGRSWNEIAPILRVTSQVMDDARVKSDALGLTIGQEQVTAVAKYRSAMNDVHEVIEAVENVIGQAIMPALTALGEWFGEHGPQVVAVFRAAMNDIVTVFAAVWSNIKAFGELLSDVAGIFSAALQAMFGGESLSAMGFFLNALKVIEVAFLAVCFVVQEVANYIGGVLTLLKDVIVGWAHLVQAALSLDWNGVKAAWNKGGQQIEDDAKARFDKIVSIAQASGQKINDAIMGDPSKAAPVTPTAVAPGGEHSEGGDDKKKSQMSALEERLAAFKANLAEQQAAQGEFQEFSKESDRAYWQAVLDTMNLSQADKLSVEKKIAADTIAIAQAGYQADLAGLKSQESQYKNNLEAKLEIAQQYAAKIAAAEGADSTKAKQAAAEVLTIQREMDAQQLAMVKANRAAMDSIDLQAITNAQTIDEAQVAAGLKTNAQLLADEKTFEDQRYQIKLQALQRDLAAEAASADVSVQKLQQINAQILALQNAHDAQMLQLTIKSTADQNKYWNDLFSSINSGFSSTISGFLKGTATIGQTIKGLFTDISNAISDTLAKMLANWLTTQIQQQIMGKVSALANIQGAAGLAGANAYASTAAIPLVGPELAPEAAETAYAGAMSFAAVASAQSGYDIPAGVNPLTQLHAREMVLPANLSDSIRGMAANKPLPSAARQRMQPLQLSLHPAAMRYSLNDWLQSEVARIAATT